MRHKLLIGILSGMVGGVITSVAVGAAMGQDKPLSSFMVMLSFVVGPLAMLVPAFLVACGCALGAAVGLVTFWIAGKFSKENR